MIDLITIVALTVAIVEAIKRTNKIASEYLPFIAMVIGTIIAYLSDKTLVLDATILTGITAGLTSVGLYENLKQGVSLLRKTNDVV